MRARMCSRPRRRQPRRGPRPRRRRKGVGSVAARARTSSRRARAARRRMDFGVSFDRHADDRPLAGNAGRVDPHETAIAETCPPAVQLVKLVDPWRDFSVPTPESGVPTAAWRRCRRGYRVRARETLVHVIDWPARLERDARVEREAAGYQGLVVDPNLMLPSAEVRAR